MNSRPGARDALDRGRVAFKKGEFDEAVEHFEEALRIDDTYAEAALRLGIAHEEGQRLDEALAAYERCLSIDPDHAHAATNIGEAYRKCERYDPAIRAYDRALDIQDDYLYAIAGRAECMRMLGDLEACLDWFDRALVIGPRHAFAIQGKAAALNTLQRYAEAMPLWDRALVIEPLSTFAQEGRTYCEQNLPPSSWEGRSLDEARQLLEQSAATAAMLAGQFLRECTARLDEARLPADVSSWTAQIDEATRSGRADPATVMALIDRIQALHDSLPPS
ncbi:MAG: tetratricopeptide repeat protein [Myxococcota bacterium]